VPGGVLVGRADVEHGDLAGADTFQEFLALPMVSNR
jgi:hypothetical protein